MNVRLLAALCLIATSACPDPSPAHRTRGKATGTALLPPAAPKTAAPKTAAPKTTLPRLVLKWDPLTGKGDVRHHLASGDLLRTCFHCGYAGYTGGLVIGAHNGSGLGFYPRRPIHGFRQINVFCAQDESIWDRSEKREYTYGWSENFGKGDDGVRLRYVRGRIIERSPARLVLQSENAGGCYRVTKLAYTRATARWWIIATRITNRCNRPVRFDFFSGDDPWLGLYRSSDGDVGWTPSGLIRNERALPVGAFTSGGIYDLGNRTLGQREGSFSNQANFFGLDPALPLPDLALFANRFAHAASEVDPRRPLNNKTLTALNLGWVDRTLQPGQGLTTAFALGLAETGTPGTIPRLPAISVADWSVWRRHLKEDLGSGAAGAIVFAAERVELELTPDALAVTGTYYLRNTGAAAAAMTIAYPILSARDRPAPASISVDGRSVAVRSASGARHPAAHFQVRVPARGLARFVIRYTQRHSRRRAGYLVTSALRWPGPIGRAVFVIRHPSSMGRVKVSYPIARTQRFGKTTELLIVRQPFVPTRELELSWR